MFITCTASYTVLEADLLAGSITNVATARAYDDGAPVDSLSATVTVTAGIPSDPSLLILKLADQSTFAAVGDVLTYKYYVINDGNVPIVGPITVTDDRIDEVTCPDTASLAPASVIMCTGSYVVTEADLLAGSVTNVAQAEGGYNGEDIISDPVEETVPAEVQPNPALMIIKRADQSFYNAVDDVLTYSYLVINTGTMTVSGPFTVTDDRIALVDCPDTASLAPGEYLVCTASYTITSADMDLGFVTNTATAQGFYNDTPVVSEPDSETVRTKTTDVNPSLLVVKYALESNYSQVGDILNYRYLVINTGNIPIEGPITVTDDKIPGVVCPAVVELLPGGSVTCEASYTVTNADIVAGEVTNTATAQGFIGDVPIVSEPDSETVPYVPSPSKTITKTVTSVGPYVIGDTITYSIVVQNTGPETLTGVIVLDLVPGVMLGACNPPMPATLAPTESMTCTASYVLTEDDITAGSFSNTAFAYSDQATPVSDTETVDVLDGALPDIAVVKVVSVDDGETWHDANTAPGPSMPSGVDPLFRFTITNTGNVVLTGIELTDSTISEFYAADLVTPCSIPASLNPDQSFICYGTLPWAAGQHVNTATVVGTYEDIPYADSDVAHYLGITDVLHPPAGIKTISNVALPELAFRMVWINNQNVETILSRITDSIPAGTTYLSGSLVCEARGSSTTASCTFDSVNKRIVWQGMIGPDFGATNEANAANEIVITFRVVVADSTNIVINQGSSITDIDGDGSLDDDVTNPDSRSDTNIVEWVRTLLVVDLDIIKSVTPSQAKIGDTVTYTIEVKNSGNEPTTNVVVTDTISSYLDIQSVSSTKGTATSSGRTATFTIGTMNAGDKVVLTIRAKVNSSAVVTVDIPNVATVTHVSHGKTVTENSNIVYVRIIGQKTLPDTGAAPIPLVEQPWFLYILSFTLGLVLFASGLISCILSDRLVKSSKAVKKNRMILQRVFGMAGMIIGGMILGLFLVSFVVTQVVVPGSPPQLGSEVAGGEEEMITELLPSGERLVIISSQAPIAEDLPDYEQPVWEGISEESPGLGEFREPLIENIDATAIRRIIIPSLNVNERVDFIPFDGQTWPLAGIREQVAWLGDTSTPGMGSNTVLAGHVTLTGGSVGPFHQLNRLQPGDKIIIMTDENSYTYVYQSTLVVDRTDMYVTEATQDPLLTLITCTSWDASAYTYLRRLVVVASLESIAPHTGG